MPEPRDHPARHPGQHRDHEHAGAHEDRQERPIAGEQGAQRQHGAEVGDEAGGQDQLAEVLAVEPGLDHHGVDHGH